MSKLVTRPSVKAPYYEVVKYICAQHPIAKVIQEHRTGWYACAVCNSVLWPRELYDGRKLK